MNKGKPSGKFAEEQGAPGRKGTPKRTGWPEEASTQRIVDGRESGRNRKAGSPR